jgi:hypothetical protein
LNWDPAWKALIYHTGKPGFRVSPDGLLEVRARAHLPPQGIDEIAQQALAKREKPPVQLNAPGV